MAPAPPAPPRARRRPRDGASQIARMEGAPRHSEGRRGRPYSTPAQVATTAGAPPPSRPSRPRLSTSLSSRLVRSSAGVGRPRRRRRVFGRLLSSTFMAGPSSASAAAAVAASAANADAAAEAAAVASAAVGRGRRRWRGRSPLHAVGGGADGALPPSTTATASYDPMNARACVARSAPLRASGRAAAGAEVLNRSYAQRDRAEPAAPAVRRARSARWLSAMRARQRRSCLQR